MSRARLALVAGAVATALAGAFAQSAWACTRGYSYAGLYSSRPAVGVAASLSMLELPMAPDTWVVISPAGIAGPFFLPGSDGAWAPVATAESWAAGGSQCNRSAYRFGGVELAGTHGSWHRLRHASKLQDPGWRLRRESSSTFRASGV